MNKSGARGSNSLAPDFGFLRISVVAFIADIAYQALT